MGDFIDMHPLWANQDTDQHSRVIEQLPIAADIFVMNTGLPTHLHVQSEIAPSEAIII